MQALHELFEHRHDAAEAAGVGGRQRITHWKAPTSPGARYVRPRLSPPPTPGAAMGTSGIPKAVKSRAMGVAHWQVAIGKSWGAHRGTPVGEGGGGPAPSPTASLPCEFAS